MTTCRNIARNLPDYYIPHISLTRFLLSSIFVYIKRINIYYIFFFYVCFPVEQVEKSKIRESPARIKCRRRPDG